MSTRSTWDSVKSLFSPQTIPMLISQGVHKRLLPVATLLLGLVLGFLWAYLISPNVYIDTAPVHLSEDWKREWVKQVAWQYSAAVTDPSYGQASAEANARTQLSQIGNAPDVIARLLAETTDPSTLNKLQAIQSLAETNQAVLNRITSSFWNANYTPILCVLALALLVGLPVIVNAIIPFSLIFAPKSKEPPTVVAGQEAARREAQKKALEAAQTAPPLTTTTTTTGGLATTDRGVPVSKHMSTYLIGDDLYDDSFSIETASGEFLGETGAGISKTIGVGDPKKVTAVEVWVFDKNDIRTVTNVFMSEHAFNDPVLKAELSAKGDPVLAAPGAVAILETQTLTIQARIVDMAYGSGALPTNSFFDRISIEIQAWPKKAGATTATASGSDAFGQTGPVRLGS